MRYKCDCGNIKESLTNSVAMGDVQSCGCGQPQNENLEGQKFGRLTLMEKTGQKKIGYNVYKAECECGNIVYVPGSWVKAGGTKSCGCLAREIASERGKTLVREKNPRWRGGTVIDYDQRKTKEYSAWRKAVVTRDNFTCQCCGGKKSIQAHHLNCFIKHPEQRFDIDNGITLCKTCHDMFHVEYGYGNNTKGQCLSFLDKYALAV